MKILVTGSRNLEHYETVAQALSAYESIRQITLVCGYNPVEKHPPGADMFAYQWARERPWVAMDLYAAKWDRECDSKCYHTETFRPVYNYDEKTTVLVRYCPRAGLIRNQEMVDTKPDICLAFFKNGARNRGTFDCVRRARKAGIKIERFFEA